MIVKIRSDFVTNSSSAHYIVKNLTDQTKTLLDLLEEAASGPWMYIEWDYPDYDEWNGMDPLSPPTDPVQLQRFREAVAQEKSFPPYMEVHVSIAWGEGGPIFSPSGLRGRTRSFDVRDVT